MRRTYRTGPILALVALLLYPTHASKVKTRIEQPAVNPDLVGKADFAAPVKVQIPSPVLKALPPAAGAHPAPPLADLRAWDVPPLNAPRPENHKPHSRSKAVFELIHYPWQLLGYQVVFLSSRPGFRAMTISDKRRIEIYVRSGEALIDTAYDLAHELGHAFDLEYNDEERRTRWCEMRGISADTPWFGCNRCPDYSTPRGDFAETFALLLLGPGNYHSHMAAAPKLNEVPELAAFCRIDLGGLWYAEAVNETRQDKGKEPELPASKTSRSGTPR